METTIDRTKFLGASDIGTIFGFNPYCSAIELWQEKIGIRQRPNITDITDKENFSESAYWGVEDEPSVAKRFTLETGLKVFKREEPFTHYIHKFLVGHIDREGIDAEGKRFVLECKTANEYAKSQWSKNGIPDRYMLQVHLYILLGNYDYGYIACKFGNKAFVIERVEREQRIEAAIIAKALWFWNFVETKKMPPADCSEICTETLKELYPQATPDSFISEQEIYNLLPNVDEMLKKEIELKCQAKLIDDERKFIHNTVKQVMGDNEKLYTNQHAVSWKNNKPSQSFDSKRFKEDHPDLYNEYCVEKPGARPFLVNELKFKADIHTDITSDTHFTNKKGA
ncbi:MAG: YqaJ viral recombinase family protein [Candidatus Cloacimonetes bacterium]|nr:YqaJ viral recombinase family protein [Candidatus Cloacimonadota bacterium]